MAECANLSPLDLTQQYSVELQYIVPMNVSSVYRTNYPLFVETDS